MLGWSWICSPCRKRFEISSVQSVVFMD